MNVFASGFPKSGNHALVKALELLGVPANVNHVPYREKPNSDHHIFIKRDPRNVIVSMLRFSGKPVTPGTFITMFRRFDTRSFVDALLEYEGWLTDKEAHVVRFEDLIASNIAMRLIAHDIGVPYIEGAFEYLPGLTRTWTGEYSDYREIWTESVESTWMTEGGVKILKVWGYE